jgi:hypothetical protein
MQTKIKNIFFPVICLMLDFIYFAFSPFCINSFFVSYLIWSGLLYKPSIFSMYFYSVIWMIEMEFFSFRGALSTVFLFATIFLATTFFRKNINTSIFLLSFFIWLAIYFLFVICMMCPATKFISASFLTVGTISYLFAR